MSGANGERTGAVRFFNTKGFGFIVPDDKGADVFFHINDVVGEHEPNPSDRVTFVVGQDRRGRPCAQQVRILT